jgi:hypothetical protein
MNAKWNRLFRALLSLAVSAVTSVSWAAHSSSAASPGTPMKPDQVNAARWEKAWTNLVNDAEETFTPSLPSLLAVEVELVVANPGPKEDDLTMTVLDASGETMASLTETVHSSDCDHTLFVIPKGGIAVTPGQTYRLELTRGTLFGWKYVLGGYEKGAATFNGKPLLPNARSTFLFRTFGAE